MTRPFDINDLPPTGHHLDPDNPEPPEYDAAGYLQGWINSDIVEPPGQDIYAAPLERIIEEPWLVALLAAGDDQELLTAARAVKDKLEEFVIQQGYEAWESAQKEGDDYEP